MVNASDMELEGPSGRSYLSLYCCRSEDYSLLTAQADQLKSEKQIARATAHYKNTGSRFRLEKRTFGNQYAQIYFFRLQRLKPHMQRRVQKQWKNVTVKGVLDLPEGQEVVVIGTLYKDMKLKPSILSEYSKDRGLEQMLGKTKFSDSSDSLVLEDESARVQLRGSALRVGELVTGLIVAVRGTAVAGGDFWVTDVMFPGLRPQPPLPQADRETKYIAFVSGLDVGDPAGNPTRLSLLLDFLTGMLGSSTEQATASKVVRLVIAGGLMASNEALASATIHSTAAQQTAALAPIRELDMAVTELASCMPVDLMPGASDPASRSLPQQPLHHCLFPGAAAFNTLNRVTNPHEFQVDGLTFLGTSGQNVEDIYKYSTREDRLKILEAVLDWGHLVPTAPDTLGSYPFAMDDPFLLDAAPHIAFAGNQPSFQTGTITGAEDQKVRLLSLPRFSDTGVLVLLNLSTLEAHPISFDSIAQ